MQHWAELRTALLLARLGTVSAAAESLGVHRATINRHIDTLETALGTRLFQRHARGYALTDAGREMLDVAHRAEEMFADLAGRQKARDGQLSGELVITALSGIAAVVLPLLAPFQKAHPDIVVRFETGSALARLEHGEAHVALRAGQRPKAPDYVVLPFRRLRFGIYASPSYVARAGMPDPSDWSAHRFIGSLDGVSRLPFADWMAAHVTQEQMAMVSRDVEVIREAVTAGIGIGFVAEHDAARLPDLVTIVPPDDRWMAPFWIVTHVDLHRTAKVQALLGFLRETGPQG